MVAESTVGTTHDFFLSQIFFFITLHFQHPFFCFKIDRTEWVLSWPGQVVIAGCQIHWTMEVTEALENNQLPQLQDNLLKQVSVKLSLNNKINNNNNNNKIICLNWCVLS